jgi:lysozyme
VNPNDATIADSFRLWNKGGGKVLAGLVKRREAEIQLYFK